MSEKKMPATLLAGAAKCSINPPLGKSNPLPALPGPARLTTVPAAPRAGIRMAG